MSNQESLARAAYAMQQLKAAGGISALATPASSVVQLPSPPPVLPGGQTWPEGDWRLDDVALAYVQSYGGSMAVGPLLLFRFLEHVASAKLFMVAVDGSETPVAIAPLCPDGAALLEEVDFVTGWVHLQQWAAHPTADA